MSDVYTLLAPYYEALDMGAFAEAVTPQILRYAYSLDWVGRRVVDLGCGTGQSAHWYAAQGCNVLGVDASESMLQVARSSIDVRGLSLQWRRGGGSVLDELQEIDLVIALDMMNEMTGVRELEAVFRSAAHALAADKLFVFDLRTLEGLAADHGITQVLRDDDSLVAFSTTTFDHERQTRLDDLRIFARHDDAWRRVNVTQARHGFPLQVVSALLGRSGFHLAAVVNAALEPINPAQPRTPRALYFARRSAS
ncbi:MAG: class I SAM-dependent methyltransferase [Anaerolineae bacterium]|nr:class I SAM-dependent methyltransferase [Anaerolineae bacterium]